MAKRYPGSWEKYKQLPGFVLGFHGCDRSTADAVLNGQSKHLKPSKNNHDWLGQGIYFWESDPWRAYQWAQECCQRPIKTAGAIRIPWVVGAVIDLGECCNLTDYDTLKELKRAHEFVAKLYTVVSGVLPTNRGGVGKPLRYLDKLVVEQMHTLRAFNGLSSYDTVRAAFFEGNPLYEGAGFHEKNHIQLAVRNEACIKGYFRLPGF